MRRVSHHLSTIVLGIMTMSFICYFSLLSLGRVRQLWASYYDLGIMHQTVYNSYMSLREADASRFLELTDPHGSGRQIKRMAIHNDVILGLLAPLYFIYDGPEALLIAQIVVVMSGAWALYLIGRHYRLNEWQVVIISLSYLLYPPLQRSILFDFHAVVMATGLLLWMHYAWLKKRYGWWVLLLILALLTKEHVGFTIAAWAIMMSLFQMRHSHRGRLCDIWQCVLDRRVLRLGLVALLSVGWVLVCVFVIMPHARTDDHFALHYFEKNMGPIASLKHHAMQLFSSESGRYMLNLLGPLAGMALFSPIGYIAVPELLINLLSSNHHMRMTYYHYTALITPWIFVALIDLMQRVGHQYVRRGILLVISICVIGWGIFDSPLPYSLKSEMSLMGPDAPERRDILLYQQIVDRDTIPVASTGQFAPYLTNRRYYYEFGPLYDKAQYVILRLKEVFEYPGHEKLTYWYKQLIKDVRYKRIYVHGDVEVYQRVK